MKKGIRKDVAKGATKRPTLERFRIICEAKGGNTSEIAKGLNCTRASIYKWFKEFPEYEEVWKDVEESRLDFTESQLFNRIKGIPDIQTDENGNKKMVGWLVQPSDTCIIFHLKTKGKHRGYIERTETDLHVKEMPQLPPIILQTTNTNEQ